MGSMRMSVRMVMRNRFGPGCFLLMGMRTVSVRVAMLEARRDRNPREEQQQ